MRPFPQSGLKYFLAQRLTLYSLVAGVAMCESGCANVASVASTPVGPQAISVTVTPSSGSVMLGNQFIFTTAVKNSSDSTVTWSVNGVAGGAAQMGTISASGVYTAPGDLPIPANLTVTATSHADISKSGSAVVTVQSDVVIGLPGGGGTNAVPVELGATHAFLAVVSSGAHPDKSVLWSLFIHDARTGTEKITQESSSANFDQRTRQFHADGIRGMALPAFREKLRQALEHDAALAH
jgi:hypothetical protein